jgi:nucleoside-diphosphate-sugar epimerase
VPLLSEKGIEAYEVRLKDHTIEGDIAGFLHGLDGLVLNIPPGLRSDPGADFAARIRMLEPHMKAAGTPHLIFVSSTSVYGEAQGTVSESDLPEPDSETGRHLLQAESFVLSNTTRTNQVLRPGGLLGPDRHPVLTLSGRTLTSGGDSRVNLVRLGDLLEILERLVTQRLPAGIYNAVYPEHPLKREYYSREASAFGLPAPSYAQPGQVREGKIVRSRRLEDAGYSFTHSIWTKSPGDQDPVINAGSGLPSR